MKKLVFLVILFVIAVADLPAQETPKSLIKNKEISITGGLTSSKIKNANLTKDENVTIDNDNGVNFSFEFSKYFQNYVGLGIGLGYSNYRQSYYEKGLFQRPDQIDKDGNKYDRWVRSDMTYTNSLSYANIPLTIHFILGSNPRFYGLFDAGIVNQFLVNGTYTKNGSIETMSRYPTQYYNLFVLSQNDPNYNDTYTSVSKKNIDRYKFYNLSVHVSLGVSAAMTDRVSLKVQPFLDYGTSDIMGPDDKGKDYTNVFGDESSYRPTKLLAFGINAGLAFNLD